jgi:hypothetical protein
MFIRSDNISLFDIHTALRKVRLAGGDIEIDSDGIREFTPRSYSRGYEFFCESFDGRYARNGRGGRAASWTDYGRFMALLYKLDPQARISFYTDATNFIKITGDIHRNNPDKYPAPWLQDRDLMIYA